VKVKENGCAICGSTWGDYWEEVEGQRTFFCCDVCAAEFKNMVKAVKAETGWNSVDEIETEGDFRGRSCVARSSGNQFQFFIRFNHLGGVETFMKTG
jgi:hypothetical protein